MKSGFAENVSEPKIDQYWTVQSIIGENFGGNMGNPQFLAQKRFQLFWSIFSLKNGVLKVGQLFSKNHSKTFLKRIQAKF